tara:strand:+ start:10654 stop:11115 length:462 start_codon:yes stop_codon:yes gene_type:complete
MTEELKNSEEANNSDKNWAEIRKKNEALEEKVAVYEAKERINTFQKAGLDTEQGIGKAVEKLYSGEMDVDSIQQFATEEFGVKFGQQDGIQSEVQQVEESQTKLDNIQKDSVVDVFGDDIVSQIRELESKGTTKQSISAKLFAIEEAKKNDKK